jgi:hypothetical protein
MNYILSNHAIEQFKLRGIPIDLLDDILFKPDKIVNVDDCKQIYQSNYMDNEKKSVPDSCQSL